MTKVRRASAQIDGVKGTRKQTAKMVRVRIVASGSSCLSTASRAGSTLPSPIRRWVLAPGTEPFTEPTTAATIISPWKDHEPDAGLEKLLSWFCLSHLGFYFQRASSATEIITPRKSSHGADDAIRVPRHTNPCRRGVLVCVPPSRSEAYTGLWSAGITFVLRNEQFAAIHNRATPPDLPHEGALPLYVN